VVVQEPVLQDFVGHRGVWVGDDVLNEAERVPAERLDDVEVSMLLGLQVHQLEMGFHVGKPSDRICHPKLWKSESSAIAVLHNLVLNDMLRVLVIHEWTATVEDQEITLSQCYLGDVFCRKTDNRITIKSNKCCCIHTV
jgi:hypothetical protein